MIRHLPEQHIKPQTDEHKRINIENMGAESYYACQQGQLEKDPNFGSVFADRKTLEHEISDYFKSFPGCRFLSVPAHILTLSQTNIVARLGFIPQMLQYDINPDNFTDYNSYNKGFIEADEYIWVLTRDVWNKYKRKIS